MVRERVQRKTFNQILEDIKEKMKDKNNKRLSRASAPGRGRSRMINKNNGNNSINTILKGVQLNNKELAVALEAEKEKVRQASVVILQLKREQQAMFLHLLLLKRKLKDQEALAAGVADRPTDDLLGSQQCAVSKRRKRSSETLDEQILCDSSPSTSEPQPLKKNEVLECEKPAALPPTVCVRRRNTDQRSRRRSERLQEQVMLSESPSRSQVQQAAASSDAAELQHSAPEPEPVPAKKTQPQPCRKPHQQQQQQPRSKPEPASRKPERGRKPERAPLKKPWENPKPRARSKSRDRSAKRAKAAPQSQNKQLNTSLGFNDTFDFDCEETVHVTPFRAKAEDAQPSSPISEEASQPQEVQSEVSKPNESCSSSPSSESEDSLYVPQKTRRKQSSPGRAGAVATRRGRLSREISLKENIPPKRRISIFKDEDSSPKAAVTDQGDGLPDCSSPISSDPVESQHKTRQELLGEELEKSHLPPVSPLVEAEMMRLDDVLSGYGDYPGETSTLLPQQTPQRFKMCKKRGLGVRTAGRGLSLCDMTNLSPAAARHKSARGDPHPSDRLCSTPVVSRKRRSATAVNYKEPSLSAKLRRGDKFTDLQFLCSPIFKQKPGRRSVQASRKAARSQQPFNKYNESFVGCR
ncbi:shugoshin 1 isoform X2 [Salarias fasciatus]|uniref:shugoshin 1 isoform X2 n=1 Tax=Salarias fasciatus TaxID=181472 RepID=UPI001176B351|nr:shugoshin 1 isoform X2 [Salarias fasciatus]